MLTWGSKRALATATGVHRLALQGSARLAAAAAESEGRKRPADAAGNAALKSPAGEGRGTPGAAPSTPTAPGARPAVATDAPLVDELDAQAEFQTVDDGALAAHGTGGSSAQVNASGSGLRLHLSAGPLHQFSPLGTLPHPFPRLTR